MHDSLFPLPTDGLIEGLTAERSGKLYVEDHRDTHWEKLDPESVHGAKLHGSVSWRTSVFGMAHKKK